MAIKDITSDIEYEVILNDSLIVGDVDSNIITSGAKQGFSLNFIIFVDSITSDVVIDIQESDDSISYTSVPDANLINPYDTKTITTDSTYPLVLGITSLTAQYYKVVATSTDGVGTVYALEASERLVKPIPVRTV